VLIETRDHKMLHSGGRPSRTVRTLQQKGPRPETLERGEKAYALRAQGLSWVEVVRALKYECSPEQASRAVNIWTEHTGKPPAKVPKRESFPKPELEVPERAEKAHALREQGLTWQEVGRELGCSDSQARRAAKDWMEHKRGENAHALKAQGFTWPEIADKLKCSLAEAIHAASVWRNHPEPELETLARGKKAHVLREQGLSWPEIGHDLYCFPEEAASAADVWRKHTGKPPEPWHPMREPRPEEVGAKAHALRAQGLTWREVGRELGCSRTTAKKLWTEHTGKPPAKDRRKQEPTPEVLERGDKAHEMRALGLSWEQIARALKCFPGQASQAASIWRKRTGVK
jgi:transcriptional regulator